MVPGGNKWYPILPDSSLRQRQSSEILSPPTASVRFLRPQTPRSIRITCHLSSVSSISSLCSFLRPLINDPDGTEARGRLGTRTSCVHVMIKASTFIRDNAGHFTPMVFWELYHPYAFLRVSQDWHRTWRLFSLRKETSQLPAGFSQGHCAILACPRGEYSPCALTLSTDGQCWTALSIPQHRVATTKMDLPSFNIWTITLGYVKSP